MSQEYTFGTSDSDDTYLVTGATGGSAGSFGTVPQPGAPGTSHADFSLGMASPTPQPSVGVVQPVMPASTSDAVQIVSQQPLANGAVMQQRIDVPAQPVPTYSPAVPTQPGQPTYPQPSMQPVYTAPSTQLPTSPQQYRPTAPQPAMPQYPAQYGQPAYGTGQYDPYAQYGRGVPVAQAGTNQSLGYWSLGIGIFGIVLLVCGWALGLIICALGITLGAKSVHTASRTAGIVGIVLNSICAAITLIVLIMTLASL